jgi:hypothetical protein
VSLGWRVVEKWGADLYGDPCRECGFGWKLSPAQAVASVRAVPGAYTSRLAGATGRERHPALARAVVLWHATRGAQRAEDVARNNAHDAHHHLWDIDRTLRAG